MAPILARVELPLSSGLERAISEFDCVGDRHADDPIACEVNEFLHEHDFVEGIENGYSTTYVLFDEDHEEPRAILGYTTVSIDSLRLTGAEKRRLGRPEFADFGAIRIAMIGVDHRHARQGHGELLLKAITGLADAIAETVAIRFLVADANIRQQGWYEHRGFAPNRAQREQERGDENTVSMRFDLFACRDADGES